MEAGIEPVTRAWLDPKHEIKIFLLKIACRGYEAGIRLKCSLVYESFIFSAKNSARPKKAATSDRFGRDDKRFQKPCGPSTSGIPAQVFSVRLRCLSTYSDGIPGVVTGTLKVR